ncbi:MAG: hypothetical protein Q9195_007783 [Heterodermia aff. obscurata]
MASFDFDTFYLSNGITREPLDAEVQESTPSSNEPLSGESVREYFRRVQPEQEELEIATRRGDIAAVKSIIEKWRAEPENKQKSTGFFGSSLCPAIRGGHLAIAAYLLETVASVNRVHFQTAMNLNSYAFLELFLHHGFDINEPWCEYYSAPLTHTFENEGMHTRENVEMTRWLLDHGADPNAESRTKNTPLSRAVHYAPMSTIQLLFDHGGPDCMNHGDLLHCATYRELPDRIEVLEYLFTKGAQRDINKILYEDHPGLFADENLIFGCDAPLHVAARTGKLDVVKFLIAHGADARKSDGKGRLAIDRARKEHHDDVVQYLAPISVHPPKL